MRIRLTLGSRLFRRYHGPTMVLGLTGLPQVLLALAPVALATDVFSDVPSGSY